MLVKQFSLNPLRPAFSPELAVIRNVRLPYGGPTGTGGAFAKGLVLGCVGGSAQSEVVTLSAGTGTHTCTFTGDKVYTVSHAANASLASVQTLWEGVFGTGNVAVTGTPGTSYVLTFQGQLANTRIGGLFAVSSAGGSPSWARTTRGTSGAGQFDGYSDGGTNDRPTTARAVLMYDYTSDPKGGLVTEAGPTGQPYQPQAYVSGFFNVGDLTGLDANAVADPGFRIVEGAAITDTGAVIGLGV